MDEGLAKPETQKPASQTDDFQKYAADPVGFISEVLHGFSWSKQQLICESVRDHRQTAVHSAHGTGKSKVAARLVCWWLSCHPPGDALAVTTAPTDAQVRTILWREINREYRSAKLPGECWASHWDIEGQMVGIGRKPGDLDMSAFQGLHAKKLLVVLDEACGIPPNIWNAAQTLTTSEDSRFLAIGNPDDPATQFADACKPGSGFNVVPISVFDTPNFTGEAVPDDLRRLLTSVTWVEEKRKAWGESSPMWTAKVLGQFPELSNDALFSSVWLRAAVNRELLPGKECVLGADIARHGDDNTEVYCRHGKVARLRLTLHDRDLMHVCGAILRVIDEEKPDYVNLDDAGLGGGVTDRLTEIMYERRAGRGGPGWRCPINPVNAGSSPTPAAEENFLNLRGEMHWNLREIFRTGDVDIEDDDDALAQLGAIKYKLDSKGRILPESKADMKKRGLPSPDKADALMLCFAPRQAGQIEITSSMVDQVRGWA